jgi:hypothetical protein
MFDPTNETRLTASEACRHRLLRRGNRPLNRSVLERWWKCGLRGPKGGRVKLESFRSGGLRLTTVEAIERFLACLNGQPSSRRQRRNTGQLPLPRGEVEGAH